ncbi:efflux RND transporter permease subunit [Novosphingobium sp. G106]|uniref:efflux RND transporter permease subunit n=1 Tax=Novosphingobium sp. G106 TaxID=2849500 RepID=UPI001C2D7401|nr:efflux RND transporter permease subunit [Novosphingobium sp. G106]MBV1692599.1 efflux RND transporter permease subunit [Novosphingobium sp. G106]
MLQLVKLALSKPYTFVVLAILILLSGSIAWLRTPTDIFPDIRIPVIAAVWTYRGLPPQDMSGRVVYYYERQLSTTVNDIDHIESQSLNGIGIVKVFFRPGVDIRTATAQVTSVSQTVLKQMPPGITPPLILNYNASTVPILQMALSARTLSEQKIFDLGQNFIRPALASVQGAAIPSPYGGRERQIQIDLDPAALQAHTLSATDVGLALAAENQIVPAGTTKIGQFEYNVRLNNSPEAIEQLNSLPIRTIGGATVLMRDVAFVHDGSPPQRNEVRVDGRRAVLMTVLKSGSASTIAIVDQVKALLPKLQATLPSGLGVQLLSDQSLFVKAAVSGVVREGVLAAVLTSLMILLFLGSWRSTVIIAASIPLAILAAVAALSAAGETLNIMTLGGLALAVGILVDDATVTIENINWHLEQGKSVRQAIMDGAEQIVGPAFVSLLCICIAFVPMFFLPGIAGFLFAPMAEAVVFAMIASFVLSRTLVPTLSNYLLRDHATQHTPHIMVSHDAMAGRPAGRHPFRRLQQGFERRFEAARDYYVSVLAYALARRRVFVPAFLGFMLLSLALVPFLGRNFFPTLDGGQISLHVRAPVGTRLEETAALFDAVEARIRETIPAGELVSIVDNIGLPVSGINRAYSNTGGIGPQDGDILITLAKDHHPTEGTIRQLRERLPVSFPGSTFSFLPADIISQILNFGSPAPLDVMVTGTDVRANEAYARDLARRMRHVAGIADVRLQQASDYPELRFDVDRAAADRVGITENDVTRSLSVSLAGSFQVAPAFWLNPRNGVSYPIVIQTPQYRTDSIADLDNLPVSGAKPQNYQLLGALGTMHREPSAAVISHYAVQPAFDVYATPQGRDLGAVAADVQKIIDATRSQLPAGASVVLRGQVETMNTAFTGLILGLIGAIALIYLLIVVNFQSWTDPTVIISALPAALAGINWMLFATHTPLSVPALTGAIMCMGVATANSVLVISFARDRLAVLGDAARAAAEAGATRFRPVLMTALAMIIGMAPMALGLGEGGEQNAPLGRAVIGGLIFATVATLVFVPVVFSIAHRRHRPAPGARPHAPEGNPVHAQ